MSQTDTTKPLGIAAAAAATAAPSSPAPASVDDGGEDEQDAADKKARSPRKIFVVVGDVYEFDSAVKAEKFLNGEDSPKEYAVLRGNRIGISQKVSLR